MINQPSNKSTNQSRKQTSKPSKQAMNHLRNDKDVFNPNPFSFPVERVGEFLLPVRVGDARGGVAPPLTPPRRGVSLDEEMLEGFLRLWWW